MTDATLQAEIAELRLRLQEADETIRAIRSGGVDAFVVEEPHGARVYTLQSADRPYRLLVEEMQQGAITLRDDGTIVYCNRRFADLVGKPLERLMGVAFRDFIPIDAQIFYESLLHRGRAGLSQGESHVQKADGGLVPVFLTFNALPPDCGAAVGVLVTDLTSQRHHEILNAAVEALEESDRRKNEFLAMLAHELRNPLAPISNAVQILRLTGGSVKAVQSASAMMERQVGQMVRLVDDLLDVSRISRGKIELRRERIELAPVVNHAIEAARPLFENMNHELTVTLPPNPIYVNADPTRLAQVVGNLLNNACKFTDRGGRIELVVSVEWRGAREEKKGEFSDDGATLSRAQGVASGDEPGGALLPRDEELPPGGTVRLNQSDSSSGSVDPRQYRRGTGPTAHQGVPVPSERRTGIAHGGGDALATESTGGLAQSSDSGRAADDVGRNQSDALGASASTGEKSGEWRVIRGEKEESGGDLIATSALATRHSPLATIRVCDRGIGIAADQLPRIFDMFVQVNTSLERSVSGLGIGLTLVKNLVEMHGGTVEVQSAGLGRGSEFVVRLPIAVEKIEPPESSASDLTLPTARRILVVDDNRDSAESLAMLLTLTGNETYTAHDGLEAVQAAATFKPDAILLDIGLPKMNGYDACRKIREQPWGQGMVLIALTGWGQDEDRRQSQEAGFDRHLVKPVDHAALAKLLAELLPTPARSGDALLRQPEIIPSGLASRYPG